MIWRAGSLAAVLLLVALAGCTLGSSSDDAAKAASRAIDNWEDARGVTIAGSDETAIIGAVDEADSTFDDFINGLNVSGEAKEQAPTALCAALDLAEGQSLEDVLLGELEPYQQEFRDAAAEIDAELAAGQDYKEVALDGIADLACAAP